MSTTSRLGLSTLAKVLDRRTSAAVAEPIALDPARDELAFYPLIYWPIVAGRPQPPSLAVARSTAYMKNGGTVIFDTRDVLNSRPGGATTPETAWLRTLLAGVDVPLLEPIPRDHVVTKTFYLLDPSSDAPTWGRRDRGAAAAGSQRSRAEARPARAIASRRSSPRTTWRASGARRERLAATPACSRRPRQRDLHGAAGSTS